MKTESRKNANQGKQCNQGKEKAAVKFNQVAKYIKDSFVPLDNGDEAIIGELIEVRPKTQEVQDILERVMETDNNTLIFPGYENHIIGYDPVRYALIYDAIGIVCQLTEENMKEDLEYGADESSMDWDEYYDRASDHVFSEEFITVSIVNGLSDSQQPLTDKYTNPILLFPKSTNKKF